MFMQSVYVYKSENTRISDEKIAQYFGTTRTIRVSDADLVLMLPMYGKRIVMFLDERDEPVLGAMQSLKIHQSVSVISTDVLACQRVKKFIGDVCLLDEVTASIPDLWDTEVVQLSNMLALKASELKPVEFNISKANTTSYYRFKFNKTKDYTTATFEAVPNKQFLKDMKQELNQADKENKRMVKETKKEVRTKIKENVKLSKLDVNTSSILSIADYLIDNGYATRSQVETIQEKYPNDEHLELRCFEEYLISGREVVSILRNFYKYDAEDMSSLSFLTFKQKIVSNELMKQNVLEAYKAEDTEFTSPILVMSYTDKDKLEAGIRKSLNYSRLIYTIPSYIRELKQNGNDSSADVLTE